MDSQKASYYFILKEYQYTLHLQIKNKGPERWNSCFKPSRAAVTCISHFLFSSPGTFPLTSTSFLWLSSVPYSISCLCVFGKEFYLWSNWLRLWQICLKINFNIKMHYCEIRISCSLSVKRTNVLLDFWFVLIGKLWKFVYLLSNLPRQQRFSVLSK